MATKQSTLRPVLQTSKEPNGARVFLQNWELEIPAAYSPNEDLDVLMRLNEYQDLHVTPEVEAALSAEVSEASRESLARQREAEASWTESTLNDRITTAFDELERKGYLARECFGLTIQGGWARAGLDRFGQIPSASSSFSSKMSTTRSVARACFWLSAWQGKKREATKRRLGSRRRACRCSLARVYQRAGPVTLKTASSSRPSSGGVVASPLHLLSSPSWLVGGRMRGKSSCSAHRMKLY